MGEYSLVMFTAEILTTWAFFLLVLASLIVAFPATILGSRFASLIRPPLRTILRKSFSAMVLCAFLFFFFLILLSVYRNIWLHVNTVN